MSGESKQKTAHYKLCKIESGDLQSLLKDIIGPEGKANHPSKRIQKVSDDDNSVIFINKFKKYRTICCGELVYIESGNYKHYIEYASELDETETETEYEINSISSDDIPDSDSAKKEKFKKEFIDSVLYFGIFKNHVLVIQSKSLRARQLETHLNWLLKRENIAAIPVDENIILSDSAPKKIYDRLIDSPVKAIRFGSPVSSGKSSDVSAIEESQVMKLGNDASRGVRMLQAIFPEFGKGLDLESVTDSANLHLSLEITYKYSTTEDGQAVIDALADSMRHNYGSDVSCELEGGEVITGDDLKIYKKISCKYTKNGILITEDEGGLFEKFFDWFENDLIKVVEM